MTTKREILDLTKKQGVSFLRLQREEWQEYIGKVTEWELERYLSVY